LEIEANNKLRSQVRLPIELVVEGQETFLRKVKSAFNLKNVLDLTIVNHYFDQSDTLLLLRFAQEIPIEGKELGEVSGVVIREGGELNLRFDSAGALKSYQLELPTPEVVKNAKRDFLRLLESKQIYFARAGEKVDVDELIAAKQRFYLQMDKSGKKRLHRAYTG
jgi:hypothetical protein